MTYVGDWHAHERFIAANARHVRAAIDALPPPLRQSARLVFTAHSIPVAMAGADRYRAQLMESARLVAARLGSVDWALVFQSRSGRPEDPWLEPDVCDYLRAERPNGLEAAVMCPIGFVCDHVEVLYDLDIEAAAGVPRDRLDDGAGGRGQRRSALSGDDGRRGDEDVEPLSVRHPAVIGAGVATNSRGRPAAVSIGASGWVAR